VVTDLRRAVQQQVKLDPGISVAYSGQFEYLARAVARLEIVVPIALAVILLLLYFTFKRFDEALLIMLTLPFALVGGVWLLYLLGQTCRSPAPSGSSPLRRCGGIRRCHVCCISSSVGRPRPIDPRRGRECHRRRRTVAAAPEVHDRCRADRRPVARHAGGSGTGSEVMSRIAAPMVGGMLSAPLLSMFVLPAAYLLLRRRTTPSSALLPAPRHRIPAGAPD
jgi:Cu(I)/Ag(I) efflux system membrane protein CusA/SilA